MSEYPLTIIILKILLNSKIQSFFKVKLTNFHILNIITVEKVECNVCILVKCMGSRRDRNFGNFPRFRLHTVLIPIFCLASGTQEVYFLSVTFTFENRRERSVTRSVHFRFKADIIVRCNWLQSMAYVCSRLISGIASSIFAGGMDVRFLLGAFVLRLTRIKIFSFSN